MFRRIYREEIQAHLAAQDPMILAEALPEMYYATGHLPGAINLPHDSIRELAPQLLPDKNAFIVVYCANTPCQNSRIAAHTLSMLGYTQVAEYVKASRTGVMQACYWKNPSNRPREAGIDLPDARA